MPNKLTDNLLAQLYLGISRDYQNLVDERRNTNEIYSELYNRLHWSLHSEHSNLHGLPASEQAKAITVLNTFWTSTRHFQFLPQNDKKQFYTSPPVIFIYPVNPCQVHDHYCYMGDTMFTWLMLDSIMHRGIDHGSNRHSAGCTSDKNNAKAILVMLCIIAAISALYAMFYIIKEFLDMIERFVYDEGWLRAGLGITAMLAGAAAGATCGIYLLAIPLIMLGISAGLANPVGLAIAGAVCLSIISAALVYAFVKWAHPNDKHAIDPKDSKRFALSESEAEHLVSIGIDPVKVKCAMVALRQEMGENGVPSLLNRWCTSKGHYKQSCLDRVRQLRRGELTSVKVGNKTFDLRENPYSETIAANDTMVETNDLSFNTVPV